MNERDQETVFSPQEVQGEIQKGKRVFQNITIEGSLYLRNTTFKTSLYFRNTTFKGSLDFRNTTIERNLFKILSSYTFLERNLSVSSILKINFPPVFLANKKLKSAVLAVPT